MHRDMIRTHGVRLVMKISSMTPNILPTNSPKNAHWSNQLFSVIHTCFKNIQIKMFHQVSDPIDRIFKPTGLATLTSSWRVSLSNNKKNVLGLFGFNIQDTVTIWPHMLFAGLWKYHRKAFEKYILGGGASVVKDFWNKMPPRPGMSEKQNWQETCVPLALHGDGVAISNIRGKGSKSIDCLSWTSLLSADATNVSTYLIWFCFGHLARKAGFSQTWPAFWKRMCKSLRALWQGTWPDIDMEGNPDPRGGQLLAGGLLWHHLCVSWRPRLHGLSLPPSPHKQQQTLLPLRMQQLWSWDGSSPMDRLQ